MFLSLNPKQLVQAAGAGEWKEWMDEHFKS